MIKLLFLCKQKDQYIWYHWFTLFIAGFSNQPFTYSAPMPKVNIIHYKTKSSTIAYLFTPTMASKSTIIGNISVFEKLNINQLGLLKENPQFRESFTI